MKFDIEKKIENFNCKCLKNLTIVEKYEDKEQFFRSREFLQGKKYHGNKSKILGAFVVRVFIGEKYPLCNEMTEDFFNRFFKKVGR